MMSIKYFPRLCTPVNTWLSSINFVVCHEIMDYLEYMMNLWGWTNLQHNNHAIQPIIPSTSKSCCKRQITYWSFVGTKHSMISAHNTNQENEQHHIRDSILQPQQMELPTYTQWQSWNHLTISQGIQTPLKDKLQILPFGEVGNESCKP